jgi:hypothetical protein
MVRLVLALALAGCYSPDLADCADRCDTSNLCPDGLTCQAGYCRTEGATGTCSSQQDMPDAANASCPPIPMQQGCQLASPQPVVPYCYVACTATTGTAALAFSPWRAAVLDTPEKLAAAMAIAGPTTMWVGLEQGSGAGSPSASWSWVTGAALGSLPWATGQPDDGDHTENGAEQCATLTGSAFSDEPCSASHQYLLQP